MIECEFTTMEIDRGHYVREGKHVAILCFGTFLPNVLHAVEVQDATVVDMRFVKPLDEALIREPAAQHVLLVTVEENVIAGGAGAGGIEFLMQEKRILPVLNLGLPDRFIAQGTQEELHAELGLDAAGIERAIREYLEK